MQHPLIVNLDDLSLDQLHEKITELNGKMTFALSTGNEYLINQIYMALESYQTEYKKRIQASQKPDQDFSDKIDIS